MILAKICMALKMPPVRMITTAQLQPQAAQAGIRKRGKVGVSKDAINAI